MKKSNDSNGFTLIEITIVILIIGVLLGIGLQSYNIYFQKQQIERMSIRTIDVNQALMNYAEINDRLPCPAPINGSTAGNDYNNEECTTANGVIRVIGTGGLPVLIGKLPAEELGLQNEMMKDVFGNYFTYAVTEGSTSDITATGAITVNERGVDQNAASTTFGEIVTLATHSNSVYALISAGDNRKGAALHDGSVPFDCTGTQTDVENCNNDAVFVASVKSDVDSNSNFYDDFASFKTNTAFDTGGTTPETITLAKDGEDYNYARYKYYSNYDVLKDGIIDYSYASLAANASGGTPTTQNTAVKVKEGDTVFLSHSGTSVKINGEEILTLIGSEREATEEYIISNGLIATPATSHSAKSDQRVLQGGSEGTDGYFEYDFKFYGHR